MKTPSHFQQSDVFRRLLPLESTNLMACDWNYSLYSVSFVRIKSINKPNALLRHHPESIIWFASSHRAINMQNLGYIRKDWPI